ncbi:hypothetical protein VB713_20430 [Anabaena cylindrica UHCC 0172]|uniref:hypothetical protein n=1 Tax=Anabaena cylindrica TaxID=1165 RepID=UPI002B20D5CD|nr:hypothetical protein [Anabaena cylindrica]MEA5553309.1 hypothetical protein [Anabaena cylindrica UHCC 0172]
MTNGFRTVGKAAVRGCRRLRDKGGEEAVIAGFPQLFHFLLALSRVVGLGFGQHPLEAALGLGGWAIVLDSICLYSPVIGHFQGMVLLMC